METKHTPGPWMFDATLKGDGSFGGSYIVSNNAKRTWPLAEVYREDNARLIAAAPELLEALKEIAELNTMYPPNYNTMTEAQKCEWTHYGKFAVIARAAIAKATGK